MKLTNLHTNIAAIIAVYIVTLAGVYFMPAAQDPIEKLASLVLGGFLAIMRPTSQTVTP